MRHTTKVFLILKCTEYKEDISLAFSSHMEEQVCRHFLLRQVDGHNRKLYLLNCMQQRTLMMGWGTGRLLVEAG